MNKSKFLATFVLLIACVVATAQPTPSAAAAPAHKTTSSLSVATASLPGVRFVHTATSGIGGNIGCSSNHCTYLNHPLLNGNPSAIFLVTQNWNPGGVGGTYNDRAIGVWYDSGQNKWVIFNQDFAAMPPNASFNIFIPAAGSGSHFFVHTATSGTGGNIGCSSNHCTYLNHPLLNGNPNAILLVTQNLSPYGTYNDRAIGVWYDSGQSKWVIFNQNLAAMPSNASFNVVVANPPSTAFIHTATSGTGGNIGCTFGNCTYLDHPLLNGNPNAIVLVTQNYSPQSVYNSKKIGIWYNATLKRWAIFNQDLGAMPNNASFNVLIPDASADVFMHRAIPGNIFGNYTTINHSLLDGNPNAIFVVTPNYNPGGVGGTYNNHPIGVFYASGKWNISNYDSAMMPQNASFNVLIPPPGANVFVHTATSGAGGNIGCDFNHCTYINHPLLNSNPNAIFLVTQNWNPGSVGGTYNTHPIGVWYSNLQSKWAIFNQDSGTMPTNASFNVMVLNDLTALPWSKAAFVHTATSGTSGNIYLNWTALNHPLTNGMPPAFVFATDNYNPGGGSGTYNNHNIGIWYTGSGTSFPNRWAIFNQDNGVMPDNASFNVLVIARQIFLPLVIK